MSQIPKQSGKISVSTLAALTKAAQAQDEEENLMIENDPEEDVPVAGEPEPGEEDLSITHDEDSKEPDTEPTEDAKTDEEPEEAPAENKPEKEDPPKDDSDKGEVTDFMSTEIKEMLDQQIGNELFAFYEYKAAASWFKREGLLGFAAWADGQAADEVAHMEKVLDYLNEADLQPLMPELEMPPTNFESPKAVVETILDREKAVTSNWRAIGSQALKDEDVATLQLAQCFVIEQMEEEDASKTILDQMKYGTILQVDEGLRAK